MYFPQYSDTAKSRDMVTQFAGYNHNERAKENEFYDMKNMSSRYYPSLSTRKPRGIYNTLTNPQAVFDKDGLFWIDGGKLYKDGVPVSLSVSLSNADDMNPKRMAKMGAYLIIMPDKVWYNTNDGTSGGMGAKFEFTGGVSFTLCDQAGNTISWQPESFYETNDPASGAYCMCESNGVATLKQWSETTSYWSVVTSTYVQINASGIGRLFDEDDGVNVAVNLSGQSWEDASLIFPNDDGGGICSANVTIQKKSDGSITMPGIIRKNKTFGNLSIIVERKIPDMEFITECQNRLWGCSKDGHEVYCCKLGDVKNWNVFQGISTDSWAATVGSDGKFTGAVTFLGYPTFFKEESMLRITISAIGAHQTKETVCRGVQEGSSGSIVILNEMLYYKSASCVCAYNGALPVSISAAFGEKRYTKAVAGANDDLYYISMHDEKDEPVLFVFDSANGIWCMEDEIDVLYFAKSGTELFFIDRKDNTLKSVGGASAFEPMRLEDAFEWFAESEVIGYETADKKYISRLNLRLWMPFGTEADFWMAYDGGGWEHKFHMARSGTGTFTVPVIPRRCDHFRWKLSGKGQCKIHSITKTVEEGSDI